MLVSDHVSFKITISKLLDRPGSIPAERLGLLSRGQPERPRMYLQCGGSVVFFLSGLMSVTDANMTEWACCRSVRESP